ncbi:MAG: zinc finger-like domain-containing protein [Patescibacteria group bacterium]|nr:zinc finger-like domain-containing protein [Patescibacteria group bacterium]
MNPEPVKISPMTGKPQKGVPSIRLDKCHPCGGTGKDEKGQKCQKCNGSGKQAPHKVSWKEKEKRIEQLATVIGKTPLKKHEIRAFCCNEWNLGWRQADRYTAWAREFLIAQAARPKEEFRSEAIAFCDQIMRDPKSSEFAKLRAFREKSQILGLYAPVGVRVADEQGKPLAAAVVAPVVNFIIPDNQRGVAVHGNGAGGNGHAETKTEERP